MILSVHCLWGFWPWILFLLSEQCLVCGFSSVSWTPPTVATYPFGEFFVRNILWLKMDLTFFQIIFGDIQDEVSISTFMEIKENYPWLSFMVNVLKHFMPYLFFLKFCCFFLHSFHNIFWGKANSASEGGVWFGMGLHYLHVAFYQTSWCTFRTFTIIIYKTHWMLKHIF